MNSSDNTLKLVKKILVILTLLIAVLLYIVIWHFDILNNLFDASVLANFMPDYFIVKLAENEAYEKGILLGFIIFISIVIYSILSLVITIKGLSLYKGDIYIKPLLNNLEKAHIKNLNRKKPYNEDGIFYKLFIQPDATSAFIAEQNVKTPLSRFLFSILFIFLSWFSIWGLSHGILADKDGFNTKIEQYIFCMFVIALFVGTVSFIIISIYRSFNTNK